MRCFCCMTPYIYKAVLGIENVSLQCATDQPEAVYLPKYSQGSNIMTERKEIAFVYLLFL